MPLAGPCLLPSPSIPRYPWLVRKSTASCLRHVPRFRPEGAVGGLSSSRCSERVLRVSREDLRGA